MTKPGGENIHSVYTHLCTMCNHYEDKHLHPSTHPKLRSSPLSTPPAKGETSQLTLVRERGAVTTQQTAEQEPPQKPAPHLACTLKTQTDWHPIQQHNHQHTEVL
jgi:hypothetical protein